jgi:hypothetical protein
MEEKPLYKPELEAITNKKLDEIQASLSQSSQYTLTRMTESNFVLGYLGMFIELAKDPTDKNILFSPSFQKWLELSAGGKIEVMIVDDEDNDKVLYNVPVIYGNNNVDYKKIREVFDGTIIRDIPHHYQQKANYLPQHGEMYLKDVLSKFSSCIGNPDKSIQDRWLDIFRRYQNGYTPSSSRKAVNAKKQQTVSTTTTKKQQLTTETDDLW